MHHSRDGALSLSHVNEDQFIDIVASVQHMRANYYHSRFARVSQPEKGAFSCCPFPRKEVEWERRFDSGVDAEADLVSITTA